MAETKINANQTNITAADIGAVANKTTMPTASATELGNIYQFSGATDANYTNGYFYKCVAEEVPNPGTATGAEATSAGRITNIVIDAEVFENCLFGTEGQEKPSAITNYTAIAYGDPAGTQWSLDQDAYYGAASGFGMTYEGTPNWLDEVIITYTPNSTTHTVYVWIQVDVQPNADPFPSQSGNSGKFLSTNGASTSWEVVDSLPSQSGNSGKFLTTDGTSPYWGNGLQNTATGTYSLTLLGGTATNRPYNINIGYLSYAGTSSSGNNIIIGYGATVKNNGAQCIAIGSNANTGTSSVAVGYGAKAYQLDSVSIGPNAKAQNSYAIAIGHDNNIYGDNSIGLGQYSRTNNDKSIAIGTRAQTTGYGAILLGPGTINDAGSFYVGLTDSSETVAQTYKMLAIDGTIPTDRFTTTPSADGTYVPALTISSGTATRSWTPTPTGHEVIEFQAPTAQNNYTWYRKYADGWVEQGTCAAVSGGAAVGVVLPVTMADTNYSVLLTQQNSDTSTNIFMLSYYNKATTGFDVNSRYAGSNVAREFIWEVKGMAASN